MLFKRLDHYYLDWDNVLFTYIKMMNVVLDQDINDNSDSEEP